MILEKGDMFSILNETDYFIITTNSTVKKNGALVMGAGIAKQVRDRWSGVDIKLGSQIEHMGRYGLIVGKKLGIFQVKRFYGDSASLELIEYSTSMLREFATCHKDKRIDLNYPGIGNGKLEKSEVEPIISVLPDNVHVWEF